MQLNTSEGSHFNHKKLILLVDQQISLNEYSDISTGTDISIISFGHDHINVTSRAHTYNMYVVTNLTSAIEAVMSYYK